MSAGVHNSELSKLVDERFGRSVEVPTAFFRAEEERLAYCCWAMARRFHRGGRLLAVAEGVWATDARHVAVEFVHPVIVGKRALPALALVENAGLGGSIARQLDTLARPHDIAMGLSPDGKCAGVAAALALAQQRGLLTVALAGGDGGPMARGGFDHCFVVPTEDHFVVQETHETLYHVLWELVHVFFEHEGLLEEA